MRGKKFLAMLLSGMMIVGGLSACTGGGNGSTGAGTGAEEKEQSEQDGEADTENAPQAEAEKDTQAQAEGASGEEITLRVLATGTDYPDVIDAAVKEKYPNITLEWETISWNDLQGKMQQYMQSGMPDIVIGKSQDANNYGNYNVWAELTDKPYLSKVNEQALPGTSINGKVLGMSATALYGGIFYNKEIFETYDLEVPETWEQMDEVVAKLEAEGITPFATHYMENILYTTAIVTGLNVFYVSETWGQDLKDGKVSAKDDAYRQGYENVKYMMDHSWKDTYSVDQTTCDARFVKGEAAMQMDGSWCINNYLTLDESFEFGMFPVPNEDGSAALIFEPDITFFQSASTQYPQAVDDIFALLTEPDVAGAICDSVSEGSLISGANVTFKNPSQEDIDKYAAAGRIVDQNLITNQLPAAGFWDECSSDLSEWLHGNMTLEEALEAADGRSSVCGFKNFEE